MAEQSKFILSGDFKHQRMSGLEPSQMVDKNHVFDTPIRHESEYRDRNSTRYATPYSQDKPGEAGKNY